MTTSGSPEFSKYIVYVDESGDHGPISAEYPVFVLAFCIFEKTAYASTVTTLMHRLKFKHFGHDTVVLHEREIRKAKPPFQFLQVRQRRESFMADVAQLVEEVPFTLVAAVIDKRRLQQRYVDPENPYDLAMKFGLERVARFRQSKADTGLLHVVFEGRGRVEDVDLELAFRRVCARNEAVKGSEMEPLFVHKQANHCGLQLADLIARPIGIHTLRPAQPNRAYEVIEGKYRRSPEGVVEGWGLKCFP